VLAEPNKTLLIVEVGPNPVRVAVTSVPAGPETGDRVTFGTVRVKYAVPVLPSLSVRVKTDGLPGTTAGRLTVPWYIPKLVSI
jgi:hypothetical protein